MYPKKTPPRKRPQGGTSTGRKRLTHNEFFLLCEALRKYKDHLIPLERSEQVIFLNEQLGFAVTPPAIRNAAEVTGVELNIRTRKSSGSTAELERQLEQLEKIVRYIAWMTPGVDPSTLERDADEYHNEREMTSDEER